MGRPMKCQTSHERCHTRIHELCTRRSISARKNTHGVFHEVPNVSWAGQQAVPWAVHKSHVAARDTTSAAPWHAKSLLGRVLVGPYGLCTLAMVGPMGGPITCVSVAWHSPWV